MIVGNSFHYGSSEWDNNLDFDLCAPETPTKKRNRSACNFDDRTTSPKSISDLIVAEDEDYFSSFDDSFQLFPTDEMDLDWMPSTPRKLSDDDFMCETPVADPQNRIRAIAQEHDNHYLFESFTSSLSDYEDSSSPGMLQINLPDELNSTTIGNFQTSTILSSRRKHSKNKRNSKKSSADEEYYNDEPKPKKTKVARQHSRHSTGNPCHVSARSAKARANNTWKDVLATSKLLVSSINDGDIIIEYMNQGFVRNFYTKDIRNDDMQLVDMDNDNDSYPTIKKNELLRNFFGLASNVESIKILRESFYKGNEMDRYINLYRNDGVPMSCHVSLSFDTRSVYGNRKKNETKLTGMLTIVSASKHGNTLLLGEKPLEKYTKQEKIESMTIYK